MRLIPPAWFLLAIALMVGLSMLAPGPRLLEFPLRYIGVGVMLIGLALVALPAVYFARFHTPIHPGHTPTALITTGPYRFSRNPIYAGMFVALLGIAILLGVTTPIIAPFIFVAIIRMLFIKREEAICREQFGQDYTEYCEKVRRWV